MKIYTFLILSVILSIRSCCHSNQNNILTEFTNKIESEENVCNDSNEEKNPKTNDYLKKKKEELNIDDYKKIKTNIETFNSNNSLSEPESAIPEEEKPNNTTMIQTKSNTNKHSELKTLVNIIAPILNEISPISNIDTEKEKNVSIKMVGESKLMIIIELRFTNSFQEIDNKKIIYNCKLAKNLIMKANADRLFKITRNLEFKTDIKPELKKRQVSSVSKNTERNFVKLNRSSNDIESEKNADLNINKIPVFDRPSSDSNINGSIIHDESTCSNKSNRNSTNMIKMAPQPEQNGIKSVSLCQSEVKVESLDKENRSTILNKDEHISESLEQKESHIKTKFLSTEKNSKQQNQESIPNVSKSHDLCENLKKINENIDINKIKTNNQETPYDIPKPHGKCKCSEKTQKEKPPCLIQNKNQETPYDIPKPHNGCLCLEITEKVNHQNKIQNNSQETPYDIPKTHDKCDCNKKFKIVNMALFSNPKKLARSVSLPNDSCFLKLKSQQKNFCYIPKEKEFCEYTKLHEHNEIPESKTFCADPIQAKIFVNRVSNPTPRFYPRDSSSGARSSFINNYDVPKKCLCSVCVILNENIKTPQENSNYNDRFTYQNHMINNLSDCQYREPRLSIRVSKAQSQNRISFVFPLNEDKKCDESKKYFINGQVYDNVALKNVVEEEKEELKLSKSEIGKSKPKKSKKSKKNDKKQKLKSIKKNNKNDFDRKESIGEKNEKGKKKVKKSKNNKLMCFLKSCITSQNNITQESDDFYAKSNDKQEVKESNEEEISKNFETNTAEIKNNAEDPEGIKWDFITKWNQNLTYDLDMENAFRQYLIDSGTKNKEDADKLLLKIVDIIFYPEPGIILNIRVDLFKNK